jgi:head-tail adaptor
MPLITRDRRLSVLQHTEDPSPDGQVVGDWLEVARVWAQVRHTGGAEQMQAGAVVSGQRATLRVHTQAFAWKPSLRLRDGATVYDVEAVLPFGPRRGFSDLVCRVLQ